MGSIPLPELDLKQQPAPQLPDYAGNMDRLMQLSNLMQNSQTQRQGMQQDQQLQGLKIKEQQQNLQDQQTLRTLSPNFITKDSTGKVTGYDYDGLFNQAAQSGVSPQTLSSFQKSISDATLAKANATKAQLENQQTLNSEAFDHLEGLRGTQDPTQRQQLWSQALQWTQQNAGALSVDPTKLPQQAPDDNSLSVIEASLGMHAQQIADAAKKATTYKDQSQGQAAAATASSTLLKQYAPTLSQSTSQNDYSTKLQAFETLHSDLAGQFPRQFDPKNPQAVLSAAMTAPELADYQQKDRLNKYDQAQENYRAQLGRQTTFENARMLHGLNQVDTYTADPQHGYGQFVSQAGAVKSAIQSAKDGNQLAASLEPMMLALGVSSFAGVHRINDTEINQAGPAVGSGLRKLSNLLSTVGTGKPTDAQLNEATSIVDSLTTAKHNAYVQGVSAVAANSGLDPSKVTVFDRGGNIASLASVQGKGAPASGATQGSAPPGATMKVPGSDGQMHWSDGKKDLGVVQ
jgi:hypothetical protein